MSDEQVKFYHSNGYVVVEDMITPQEVEEYKKIYNDFLSYKIDVGMNRSDLGDGIGSEKTRENITQIMWPSDFVAGLTDMALHQRALAIGKELIGEDAEMDFDMLINKAPHTNTPTPWHQDESYWVNVPDKRAASCWVALDNATKDNGCMWFVPGSNLKEVRPHRFAGKAGGALTCDASEDEGVAVELKPGSCTFHAGRTLHYSRGNTTDNDRKAYIINYRPAEMIAAERAQGFDHGRGNASNRQLKNDEFEDK